MPGPATDSRNRATVRSGDVGWGTTVATWLLVLMVVVAPIPFGSVELFWIFVWVAVAAVAVGLVRYRSGGAVLNGVLAANMLVVLGFVVVIVLQSAVPGPLPREIWGEASAMISHQLPPISGSVRDVGWFFLGRPVLTALVLAAAIGVGMYDRLGQMVVRAILWSAAVYGVIGLIALVFDITALRPHAGNSLAVFFISKNTSATYLGSALLIAVALIGADYMRRVRPRDAQTSSTEGKGAGGKLAKRDRILVYGAGLLLLCLLPLTQSRAGVMITLTLLAGVVLVNLGTVMVARRAKAMRLVAVVLAVFALVFVLSGDIWKERQVKLGFDTLHRFDFYQSMFQAIQENPMLGMGLGSFVDSFPQFRSAETGIVGLVNIGHSTIIELAYEGGIPLFILNGLFVLLCGGILLRGVLRSRDPYILAGLLVGILGLAHSAIDFSLQIPGYAIIYAAIVGVAIGRVLLMDLRAARAEAQPAVTTPALMEEAPVAG